MDKNSQRRLDGVEIRTIESYDAEAEQQFSIEEPPQSDENIAWARGLMKTDPLLLDVGCGHGRMIPLLRNLGINRYVGIDPSVGMLAIARREYPGVDFQEMDLYSLPDNFSEGHFDAFLALMTLSHVPSHRMKEALSAIRKVTCLGGIGVIYLLGFDKTVYLSGQKLCQPTHPGPVASMTGWPLAKIVPLLFEVGFELFKDIRGDVDGIYQITVKATKPE